MFVAKPLIMTVTPPGVDADAEVGLVVAFLLKTKPSQLVTYDQISIGAGFRINSQSGRYRLSKARKHLMEEHQMVFRTITGHGLKLLDDPGKVDLSRQKLRGIRVVAKRARNVALSVNDFAALSPADKGRHQAVLAVSSAVEAIAANAFVRNLEKPVASTPSIDMKAIMDGVQKAMAKPSSSA